MLRKLSLCLCIIFIIGTFSFPAYTVGDDIYEDIYKQQYILNKLGIIELGETDDVMANVTRAQFASYVAKAVNLEQYTSNDVYFVDVPEDYWAHSYINLLVDLGVVSGTSAKRFEPERIISYKEACKMLVVATGYGETIVRDLYENAAVRVGIRTKVANTAALTVMDAIKLVYDAMTISIAKVMYVESSADNDVPIKVVDETENMFSFYHDVYIRKGRIESVYGATIKKTFVDEKNEIYINGNLYNIDAEFDFKQYLGRSVEYFVLDNPKDDIRGTVLFAEPVSEDVVVIDGEDIDSFSVASYVLKYYKNNSASSISIAKGAVVVKNGALLKGSFEELIKEFKDGKRKGTVTLIESADSGKYDLVIVNSARTYIVSGYNAEDEMLYGDMDMAPIDISKYEVANIHTDAGVATTVPTIFPVAMSIEESDSDYAIDITIYSEQKALTFESYAEGKREITFEGEKYTVDKSVFPYLKSKININESHKVIFDKFGEIIYIFDADSGMQFGYLRGVGIEKSAFDSTVMVSLYEKDGAFHIYNFAKNVRVDGKNYKKSEYENMLKAFPGSTVTSNSASIERQLIRFTVNSNGEINEVDTYNLGTAEDPKTTLYRKADGNTALIYNQYQKRFGLVDIYDSSTLLMSVPAVDSEGRIMFNGISMEDNESLYKVGMTLQTDLEYNIESYYLGDEAFTAAAMLLNSEPTQLVKAVYMFDSLSKELDADGNVQTVLNGYRNGAIATFYVHENCIDVANTLKQGDLYYVDSNFTSKTAMTIRKIFDAETLAIINADGYTNPYWFFGNYDPTGKYAYRNSDYQISRTYPHSISGNLVKGSYELYNAYNGIIDEINDINSLAITVYDKTDAKNPIKKGSIADIVTFKQAGEKCSLMIMNHQKVNRAQVFIYKR